MKRLSAVFVFLTDRTLYHIARMIIIILGFVSGGGGGGEGAQ